jgi:hypothetical protein
MRSSIASSKKQHACMHAAVTVSRSAAGPGVDDRLHALRRNSNIFESLAAVVVRRRHILLPLAAPSHVSVRLGTPLIAAAR